jgi:hypothetical protein
MEGTVDSSGRAVITEFARGRDASRFSRPSNHVIGTAEVLVSGTKGSAISAGTNDMVVLRGLDNVRLVGDSSRG